MRETIINIERSLLPALQTGLALCHRADFCVGYFNLRCWQGGEGNQCRLLIGMQEAPREELRAALSLTPAVGMDQGRMLRLKQRVAKELRQQLMVGVPTETLEHTLDEIYRFPLTESARDSLNAHLRLRISDRVAQLICITPEFDDLFREV